MGRLTLIFGLFVSFVFTAPANSSERHALVIGNSDYGSGFALATPVNDSTAIATKLAALGYQVHSKGPLLNLGLEQFNNEIDSFLSGIEDGSSTLIYYAGHGAATSQGSNYLIPILPAGITLKSEGDVKDKTVLLQGILERVEQRNPNGVNVFFIDACRDGPVDTYTRTTNLTGLSRIDTAQQPRGSFVGFSTEYGALAIDNNGSGHSPFASALLSSLDTHASAPIEIFYKSITSRVLADTQGQQFPIQEIKLSGQHCVIECRELTIADSSNHGTLNVTTTPDNAEVCYLVESWDDWSCGRQMVVPLNEPVAIKVTANGYKSYSTTTTLTRRYENLAVDLKSSDNRAMKILGGVAAAVVVGALLGSSGGGSPDNGTEQFTVTIVRP